MKTPDEDEGASGPITKMKPHHGASVSGPVGESNEVHLLEYFT